MVEDFYRESEGGGADFKYPRPESVKWQKELANTVQLIGYIQKPIEFKNTQAGKASAWTRLAFKPYKSNETIWFKLKFCEELANIAAIHVKEHDQVYVSGSLDFYKEDGEDNKLSTIPEVNVKALSFVEHERGFPQSEDVNAYLQNKETEVKEAEVKLFSSGKKTTMDAGSTEKLWQAYFAKPDEWWDNRQNKKNPRGPDFKHKNNDEALWIWSSPSWVKSRLDTLEKTKHEERQENDADGGTLTVPIGKRTTMDAASTEKLWQIFFFNPSEWWDNRNNKKNPKAPDFKHKSTNEVLWVESFRNPSWVESELKKYDKRMKDSHQFTRSRESLSTFGDRDLMF